MILPISKAIKFLGNPLFAGQTSYWNPSVVSQLFGNVPQSPQKVQTEWGWLTMAELYAKLGLRGHNGMDIVAPMGEPVYASHNGIIEVAGNFGSRGIGVTIMSASIEWLGLPVRFKTVYWHLQDFNVSVGQIVIKGDLIGHADNTGWSTGSHLHYGLDVKKVESRESIWPNNGFEGFIDPLPFMVNYDPEFRLETIKGTDDLIFNKTMKLVILGKEQYLVDKDGKAFHIYNAATLNNLYSAGIISTLTPEPVTSVNDTGKEFVILTQE